MRDLYIGWSGKIRTNPNMEFEIKLVPTMANNNRDFMGIFQLHAYKES